MGENDSRVPVVLGRGEGETAVGPNGGRILKIEKSSMGGVEQGGCVSGFCGYLFGRQSFLEKMEWNDGRAGK